MRDGEGEGMVEPERVADVGQGIHRVRSNHRHRPRVQDVPDAMFLAGQRLQPGCRPHQQVLKRTVRVAADLSEPVKPAEELDLHLGESERVSEAFNRDPRRWQIHRHSLQRRHGATASADITNVNVCHDNGVARFLFVVVPVVARLWPAVAIGDALAASGHDVAWCGPERDLRPLVGPDVTIFATGKRSYRAFREVGLAAVRELWDEYVLPLNRFIQGPVDRAVAEFQPDVVFADQYALAGAAAAHRHGVPWATLCAGVLELTPPAEEPGVAELVRSRLERVREAAGVAADDDLDLLFSPYLVLATTTR